MLKMVEVDDDGVVFKAPLPPVRVAELGEYIGLESRTSREKKAFR
jgi:hypothetical protein